MSASKVIQASSWYGKAKTRSRSFNAQSTCTERRYLAYHYYLLIIWPLTNAKAYYSPCLNKRNNKTSDLGPKTSSRP